MATIKCTAVFRFTTQPVTVGSSGRTAGFSESWYFNGDLSQAIQAFAGTTKTSWCGRRASLLPFSCSIVEQRYQQVAPGPVGASIPRVVEFKGALGTCDIPQMTLLVSVPASDTTNVKHYEMRGIPDDQVKGGEFSPEADWTNSFGPFASALASFRFRGQDLSLTNLVVKSIDVAGICTTTTAHGFQQGDTVHFTHLKDAKGNSVEGGNFVVDANPTATSFSIINWPLTRGAVAKGRVRKLAYVYPTPDNDNVKPEYITTRRVGRPFGGYRGRR